MNPTVGFLASAGALVAIALTFIVPVLWRPKVVEDVRRARLNIDVYREQLAEVDRDCALGIISPDAAESSRDELRRRLLDDTRPEMPQNPAQAGKRSAVVLVLLLPVLAALLYSHFGNLSQVGTSAMGASAAVLGADALAARVREHPADARAWVLLARAKMERSEFADAVTAYRRAVAASSRVAQDPAVLCEFADALAMEQGGTLQGRPADLVKQALAIDGRHPLALEMAGSAAYERYQYAEAAELWEKLLTQLAPDSERYRELAVAIDRARSQPTASH